MQSTKSLAGPLLLLAAMGIFCFGVYTGAKFPSPWPVENLRPEDKIEVYGPPVPFKIKREKMHVKDMVCIYQGRGQWGSCREVLEPEEKE